MSSRSKSTGKHKHHQRSDRAGQSGKHQADYSSESLPWSEWAWDEAGGRWYRGRADANGQYEYEYGNTAAATPFPASGDISQSETASSSSRGRHDSGYQDFEQNYPSIDRLTEQVAVTSISDPPPPQHYSTAYDPSQSDSAPASGSVTYSSQPINIDRPSGYGYATQPGGGYSSYASHSSDSSGPFYQGNQSTAAGPYGSNYGTTPTPRNVYGSSSTSSGPSAPFYTQGSQQTGGAQWDTSRVATPKPTANSPRIKGTGGNKEKLDPIQNTQVVIFRTWTVLWMEPRGETSSDATTVTEEEFETSLGGKVYTSIRRFVVVANDKGHCQCLPIMTYGHQATTKFGVHSEDHAIIYTGEYPPTAFQGEGPLGKAAIQVIPKTPRDKLAADSRINYAKIYTVEHNVKVLFVGKVADSSQRTLMVDFDATWCKKYTSYGYS